MMRDELSDSDFDDFELEDFDVEEEDEFETFDCHMMTDKKGSPLGCGKAGSEECDFECPYARLFGWN